MPDESVTLEPNVGVSADTDIAVDDVSGVKYQRVKLDAGGDGAADPVSSQVPGAIPTSGAALAIQTDDAGGGVTYVGEAAIGSATSGALWRIKRITIVSADAAIEWADGDGSFDNIWDNRAALSYS